MTEPVLQDPQLAAFWAADPSRLAEPGPAPGPVRGPQRSRRKEILEVGLALAAAFLVIRTLVARELQAQRTAPEDVAGSGLALFQRYLPVWIKLAVPAIRRAYDLGDTHGVTEIELERMAAAYAANLGEYLSTTSAQAMADGFNQQLAARWSERVAWERARVAYGLDAGQTRAYLASYLTGDKAPAELVPDAARVTVERALLLRADRLGQTEAWRAMQAGRAIVWLMRQRAGNLPPSARKRWLADEEGQLCRICGPLSGTEVGLGEMFISGDGEAFFAPGAHPNCHCELQLIVPLDEDGSVVEKQWREERHPRRRGQFAAVAGGAVVTAGAVALSRRTGGRRFVTAPIKALEAPRGPGGHLLTTIDHDPTDVKILTAMDDEQLRTMMRHAAGSTTNNERYQRALAGITGATGHLQAVSNGRDLAHDYPLFEVLAGYGATMKERSDLYLRLLAVADPQHTPALHRGMHGVEHQIGDLIDMRTASSFSADQAVAESYADALARDTPRGVYTLPAGAVGAVPFSGPEAEWLTGGLFRVVGKAAQGDGRHRYQLERADTGGRHEVLKAYDPHEPRHSNGRWARMQPAATKPAAMPTAVRTRDAFFDNLMEQARSAQADEPPAAADPFASKTIAILTGAGDPLAGKRVATMSGDPLAAKGDPLAGRPPAPAGADMLASRADPLASAQDPLASKPAPGRRVIRRRIIVAPPFPRRAGGTHAPYYLPVEDLAFQMWDQNPDGEFFSDYDTPSLVHGMEVDFGAHFADVVEMYELRKEWADDARITGLDHGWPEYEEEWRPPRPLAAISSDRFHNLVSGDMDVNRMESEDFWTPDRMGMVGPVRDEAFGRVDDTVGQLGHEDLAEIFYNAGYEVREPPPSQRARIIRAVQLDETSPLAAAYADYIAFTNPGLAGANGEDMAREIGDYTNGHGLGRPFVPEIFVFDQGFAAGDGDGDGAGVPIQGTYKVDEVGYHSAHDLLGGDSPVGVAGYRLVHLKPQE